MATSFKLLGPDDVVSTKTLLFENIPLTGTVISSSTYGTSSVKSYTHGMFKSVFDYPYLSSSANQLMDITIGRSNYGGTTVTSSQQNVEKKTIYNQMSKVLYGTDATGSILRFDDNATDVGGTFLDNFFFLNFSRLLVKDEIKKGTFSLQLGVGSNGTKFSTYLTIQDVSASTNYRTDSPTGEYAPLYVVTSSNPSDPVAASTRIYSYNPLSSSCGFIFYQAGIAAISPYVFSQSSSADPTAGNTTFPANSKGVLTGSLAQFSGSIGASKTAAQIFVSGTIEDGAEIIRQRIRNVEFNNTTELNSTVYFCRVANNEFNYSSNPTYLSNSKIVVKGGNAANAPISYITTVGLYSADNQLLAVAKLSEPLRKSPTEELILRVRLDY